MKLIQCLIKQTATLLLGVALSFLVIGSANAQDDDAGHFLKALQERAIHQLSDESISEVQREKQFRSLLTENFDINGIARFVVGKYWRKAKTGPRDEFMAIFEDVMVQRFLPAFTRYADSKFAVTRVVPRKNFIVVYSTVQTENGEVAKILWRISQRDDSSFVITDVAPEGISLRSTYKSDYTSALKSLGGDLSALNGKLRKKIKSGSFAPKSSG